MKSLETELSFVINDLARSLRTRADQRARRRGMTRAQWVILVWIDRKPGITQNELAGLVEVEPITVGRLIDRLEARNLVERLYDPKDRRLRRLRLREEAKPILAEIQDYREEINELITAGLDAPTVEILRKALVAMKANVLNEIRLSKDAM
jgi:MarR family transcriptional regulator, transcriptional regulator for hemolysin